MVGLSDDLIISLKRILDNKIPYSWEYKSFKLKNNSLSHWLSKLIEK